MAFGYFSVVQWQGAGNENYKRSFTLNPACRIYKREMGENRLKSALFGVRSPLESARQVRWTPILHAHGAREGMPMLSLFLRPARNLVAVLVANDSSRQIAAGVALGMLLGLVPKGNLIALALVVLLFALRVNRTAGLMSAALFSSIGMATDPFTHRLGAKLLAVDSLQPHLAWLYDLPLGPWIGFNNTVVLGSFVMGLYLFYPCYLIARLLHDRFQPPIARWLMRRRVARMLLGADLASRWSVPSGLGAGS